MAGLPHPKPSKSILINKVSKENVMTTTATVTAATASTILN